MRKRTANGVTIIRPGRASRLLLTGVALVLASSCGTTKIERVRTLSQYSSSDVERPAAAEVAQDLSLQEQEDGLPDRTTRGSTRVPVIGDPRAADGEDGASTMPAFAVSEVDAVIPPLPVPSFIDLVFGQLLKVPHTTGPGVAARTEIVQLRSSGTMKSDVFFNLVKETLRDYGIQVSASNGVYQVLEETALKARMPRFIKSRARPETPAALRPVVQFVELNAIDASRMADILRQAFGQQSQNLTIDADTASNYIILNGLPEDVNAALSIIYEMDELQYAGTQVQRFSPAYWDVVSLANELARILDAEGWQVSFDGNQPKPILLLPVDRSNDLLVFTREPKARSRIAFWIRELDRPAQKGDAPQTFVYSVRNLDAAILAETVNQVVAGMEMKSGSVAGRALAARAATAAAGQGQQGALLAAPSGGIVVDPLGNRLIFSGTPSEYEKLLPLLRQLDQPPAEVLIEVMIAQVTLTDSTRFGVEWAIDSLGGSDLAGLASQSVGLGAGGLDFGIFPGNAEVQLNAFAENDQVTVLSTPRLLARSGASAQVQVGTDVPILTAQRTPDAPVGGGVPDVLSQVEYRSTGIILAIEPIVFSDNRIDLNISQEVSATLPTSGPVSSPSFSNTSVTTLLSLEDGGTAVIGGLIQDNVSRNERGIPVLKDIPILGNVFSNETMSVDRTELVILITAYVIRGQDDKTAFARKFQDEIDRTMSRDNLITLTPRRF